MFCESAKQSIAKRTAAPVCGMVSTILPRPHRCVVKYWPVIHVNLNLWNLPDSRMANLDYTVHDLNFPRNKASSDSISRFPACPHSSSLGAWQVWCDHYGGPNRGFFLQLHPTCKRNRIRIFARTKALHLETKFDLKTQWCPTESSCCLTLAVNGSNFSNPSSKTFKYLHSNI